MIEEQTIQVILLTNNKILVGEISEVVADIGQPDCRITNPYEVLSVSGSGNYEMKKWIREYTDESEFMIMSDKILTITEPSKNLLDEYLKLIK